MTTLKFIVALIVILLIADFGVRNNVTVSMKFHFFNLFQKEREVPLFAVILVSVFIGLVVAWIAEHLSSFRIKAEARQLRKTNAQLESELAGYREKELLEPAPEETEESDDTSYSLPEEAKEE